MSIKCRKLHTQINIDFTPITPISDHHLLLMTDFLVHLSKKSPPGHSFEISKDCLFPSNKYAIFDKTIDFKQLEVRESFRRADFNKDSTG
jgi:hypothetical protein